MDSQDIRYRGGDDRDDATTAMAETERKHALDDNDKGKRDQKRAMAKRGLKSLTVAVAAPVLVTLIATYFLGGGGYGSRARSSAWIPPLWVLHATRLVSSGLMGLAAWLVWVDGGFHKKPNALYLYLAQFMLCLFWGPVTFLFGSRLAGLAVWLAQSAALFGCYKAFNEISPVAGNLVKPCLAFAAFVAAVNVKLAFA